MDITITKIIRVLKWSVASLILLCCSTILILNFVFFESTIQWGLKRFQNRTGIEISFDQVKGSLLTGELQFTGLNASRSGNAYTDFSITIAQANVNIAYIKSFFGSTYIEGMQLSTVSGRVDRIKSRPEYLKNMKKFYIRNLTATNLDLNIVNRCVQSSDNSLRLKLSKINIGLFRRYYTIYDVFFKSTMSGTIDNAILNISTQNNKGKSVTHWNIRNMPASMLHKIKCRSFDWVEQGMFDITVVERSGKTGARKITTKWSVDLKDIKVSAPQDLNMLKRIAFKPVAKYLNSNDGNHKLVFGMTLKEQDFAGRTSLDVKKLRKGIVTGTLNRLIGGR